MSVTTGVAPTTPERDNNPPSSKAKQRKIILIGGAGLAGLLLLSHRGASTPGGSQSTPAAQLNSTVPYSTDPSLIQAPGGGYPVDTGGGDYTYQGPSATTAPAVDVQPANAPDVTISTPAQTTPAGPVTPSPNGVPPGSSHKRSSKRRPKPVGIHPNQSGHKKPKHTGKTSKVTKTKVESPHGSGSGVTVHGRTFPGATSHHMGAPRKHPDGTVSQPVTVNHGGHTSTHISHNNGRAWTDNPQGLTPPSRGVPVHTSSPRPASAAPRRSATKKR